MDLFFKRNKCIGLNNPLFFDAFCKFCYDTQTPGNKLYSFCDCKGSILWTHLNCHNQWIKQLKKNKKIYDKCEICNTNYKKLTTPQNKTLHTLSVQLCHRKS